MDCRKWSKIFPLAGKFSPLGNSTTNFYIISTVREASVSPPESPHGHMSPLKPSSWTSQHCVWYPDRGLRRALNRVPHYSSLSDTTTVCNFFPFMILREDGGQKIKIRILFKLSITLFINWHTFPHTVNMARIASFVLDREMLCQFARSTVRSLNDSNFIFRPKSSPSVLNGKKNETVVIREAFPHLPT